MRANANMFPDDDDPTLAVEVLDGAVTVRLQQASDARWALDEDLALVLSNARAAAGMSTQSLPRWSFIATSGAESIAVVPKIAPGGRIDATHAQLVLVRHERRRARSTARLSVRMPLTLRDALDVAQTARDIFGDSVYFGQPRSAPNVVLDVAFARALFPSMRVGERVAVRRSYLANSKA